MESFSYQSYPDSGHSSPRSREVEFDNPPPPQSWVDDQATYKVKFMCSYGGKILPRSHDNQLTYSGGDTKIMSVDRSIKFNLLSAKLSSLCDPNSPADICFKYQLPGEDLDALISVTNDEDLEHMMSEYDRLNRNSVKQPARLRIFLFPVHNDQKGLNSEEFVASFKDGKPEGQWFVDVLNTVRPQQTTVDATSPPAPLRSESPGNPDFLFGFDKSRDSRPDLSGSVHVKDVAVGEPAAEVAAIQRQIERFQISEPELHKQNDDTSNPRVYQTEYYSVQEKAPQPAAPTSVPVSMSIPASYMSEMQMPAGNYPAGGPPSELQQHQQQPVYIIQPQTSMYHPNSPMKHVTGPGGGQSFYSIPQRVMPADVYRDQPVYTASMIQQQQVTGYSTEGMGMGMMRQSAGGTVVTDQGYAQVSYDSAGRPFYYTVTGGLAPPSYQVVNAAGAALVDGRGAAAGGGGGSQESGTVGRGTQNSSA